MISLKQLGNQFNGAICVRKVKHMHMPLIDQGITVHHFAGSRPSLTQV